MAKRKKKAPAPRNSVVLIARSRISAGPMRDRRMRRAKDRLQKEMRESQSWV